MRCLKQFSNVLKLRSLRQGFKFQEYHVWGFFVFVLCFMTTVSKTSTSDGWEQARSHIKHLVCRRWPTFCLGLGKKRTDTENQSQTLYQ